MSEPTDSDLQEEPVDLSGTGRALITGRAPSSGGSANNPFLDMWASAYGAAYANYLSLVGAEPSEGSSVVWGDMLSKRAELERSVEEYMRHIRAAWEAKMHIESIYRENYQQLSLANMLMMGAAGGATTHAAAAGGQHHAGKVGVGTDVDVSNPANIFVISDAQKSGKAAADAADAEAGGATDDSELRLRLAKKSSSIFSMPTVLPPGGAHGWIGLASRAPPAAVSAGATTLHDKRRDAASPAAADRSPGASAFPAGRRIARYRPLNGKHVRPGTGARISTLIALREKIQQRRRLKEVYAKVAFLRNLTSERMQEPGQVPVK